MKRAGHQLRRNLPAVLLPGLRRRARPSGGSDGARHCRDGAVLHRLGSRPPDYAVGTAGADLGEAGDVASLYLGDYRG